MSEGQAYDAFRDGQALLAAGHAHAALIPLERALAEAPDAASVRETIARAYFSTARFGRAAEHFAAALELDPVNDYAHFGLGLSLSRQGDVAGARRHLHLALAMRPDRAEYRDALHALGPGA